MSKSFVLGFIVGTTLLIVAGVGASKLQDKNAKLKEEDEKQYQIEVVDATPVQSDSLTEQQRIHSRIFAHYKEMRSGLADYHKISDFFAHPKGKVMGTIITVGFGPVPEPKTPEEYLSELTQTSDAVIKGTIIRKVSQITEDDSFIFTDYDIVVTEIIKNNATVPLELGKPIIVTRPGGKITKNGILVKVDDEKFLPLPLNHNVLLFLSFIPETGAYKTTEATGSFELNGSSVRPLTGVHLPFEPQDEYSFLQTARLVSNK